jgi:hypothetical protein
MGKPRKDVIYIPRQQTRSWWSLVLDIKQSEKLRKQQERIILKLNK